MSDQESIDLPGENIEIKIPIPKSDAPSTRPAKLKRKTQPPQKEVEGFWRRFVAKYPGTASTLLPDNQHAYKKSANAPSGDISGQNAATSYLEAAKTCEEKVKRIADECRRINQKYRDLHFDIEFDLMRKKFDCLASLTNELRYVLPKSVKRVSDIFDDPKFYIDGAAADDVRQGYDGNCWFLAAVSALCNKEDLINKVCVAKDEAVGIYGFVFYRDGEWISEVIDDKLYLTKPDWDQMSDDERDIWDELQNRKNPKEEYRKANQKGSRALHFAQCKSESETWLPLLEKAYAKAHGDYNAIHGGFVGEGLGDLTGGVTTELFSSDILDKKKFWEEELIKVNKDFLFGCSAGMFAQQGDNDLGIYYRHAYSIMRAVEIDGKKFVKLRNPWGKKEWNGPWSDGSEEWTGEWLKKLEHKFGDDGVFWILYEDLLSNFQHLDRTRLFTDQWKKVQQWTALSVPWTVDYLDTKFQLTVKKTTPVVLVLSQLDTRYFKGLEGQYTYQLQFRLHKKDQDAYILRSHGNYYMRRSVSAECTLDPGTYYVLVKISASRDRSRKAPLEVIREWCNVKPEKLLAVGLSYDLAHAKGGFKETNLEKRAREKREAEDRKRSHAAKRLQHRKNVKLRETRRALKADRRKSASGDIRGGAVMGDELVIPMRPKGSKPQSEADSTAAVMSDSGDDVDAGVTPASSDRPAAGDPAQPGESGTNLGAKAAGSSVSGENGSPSAPGEKESSSASAEKETSLVSGDESVSTERPVPGETESTSASADKADPEARSKPQSPPPSAKAARSAPPAAKSIPQTPLRQRRVTHDAVSDTEASWDSAEDGPWLSDRRNAILRNEYLRAFEKEEKEEPDTFEADPWNAVCVVGLRVYSRDTADEEVRVEVVQPEKGEGTEKKLDLDDRSYDGSKTFGPA